MLLFCGPTLERRCNDTKQMLEISCCWMEPISSGTTLECHHYSKGGTLTEMNIKKAKNKFTNRKLGKLEGVHVRGVVGKKLVKMEQ